MVFDRPLPCYDLLITAVVHYELNAILKAPSPVSPSLQRMPAQQARLGNLKALKHCWEDMHPCMTCCCVCEAFVLMPWLLVVFVFSGFPFIAWMGRLSCIDLRIGKPHLRVLTCAFAVKACLQQAGSRSTIR